jgi:hypothetical protein
MCIVSHGKHIEGNVLVAAMNLLFHIAQKLIYSGNIFKPLSIMNSRHSVLTYLILPRLFRKDEKYFYQVGSDSNKVGINRIWDLKALNLGMHTDNPRCGCASFSSFFQVHCWDFL